MAFTRGRHSRRKPAQPISRLIRSALEPTSVIGLSLTHACVGSEKIPGRPGAAITFLEATPSTLIFPMDFHAYHGVLHERRRSRQAVRSTYFATSGRLCAWSFSRPFFGWLRALTIVLVRLPSRLDESGACRHGSTNISLPPLELPGPDVNSAPRRRLSSPSATDGGSWRSYCHEIEVTFTFMMIVRTDLRIQHSSFIIHSGTREFYSLYFSPLQEGLSHWCDLSR